MPTDLARYHHTLLFTRPRSAGCCLIMRPTRRQPGGGCQWPAWRRNGLKGAATWRACSRRGRRTHRCPVRRAGRRRHSRREHGLGGASSARRRPATVACTTSPRSTTSLVRRSTTRGRRNPDAAMSPRRPRQCGRGGDRRREPLCRSLQRRRPCWDANRPSPPMTKRRRRWLQRPSWRRRRGRRRVPC